MDYPLRSVIRCRHQGKTYGSVVVIRGDPIYDENQTHFGYKHKYLQIRRGNLKGYDCRETFDTLDEWHRSLGIYPEPKDDASDSSPWEICIMALFISFGGALVFFAQKNGYMYVKV